MKTIKGYNNPPARKQRPPYIAAPGERIFSRFYPASTYSFPGGWAGNKIEQVQHYRNWQYIAIKIIASLVAQVMPEMAFVSRAKIPGKTTKALAWQADSWPIIGPKIPLRHKALGGVVKPHEELEPLEYDHGLIELMTNPNAHDTSFDLFFELLMYLGLCGEAYLWTVPSMLGNICELWCFPSHWVYPWTGTGYYQGEESHALIREYRIWPYGAASAGFGLRVPPEEIISFKWKNPLTKIVGHSPQSAAAMGIDTEESIEKSRWAQMSNRGIPDAVIELGEQYEDMDVDMTARAQSSWNAKYQGEYNAGKVAFMPPGSKITPISFDPTRMQYMELGDQLRDYILANWGVNRTLAGLVEGMTYGGNLAALQAACFTSINPMLAMIGQKLTKTLGKHFSDAERQVRIWYADMSPTDPAQVNQDIAQDIAGLAITPDEIRALRGREPYKLGVGNNPWAQGPGGWQPIPMNEEIDMAGLGADIAEFLQASGEAAKEPTTPAIPGMKPEQVPEGMPGADVPEEAPDGEPDIPGGDEEQQGEELPEQEEAKPEVPGVEEPNGPPKKDKRYNKVALQEYAKALGNLKAGMNGVHHV